MEKKIRKGMSGAALFSIIFVMVLVTVVTTGYFYYQAKYDGDAQAYSYERIKYLEDDSFEYKMASLFYSPEEIATIKANHVDELPPIVDEDSKNEIEIKRIAGSSYEGVMMIVHNPEDITVAVNPDMNNGQPAPKLDGYIERFHALGGLNAGGFEDVGYRGNGSTPWGIVIHDGKLIAGNKNQYLPIIGITKDHKLMCVDATAKDALDWGIVEAVTFGPTLINNYQVAFKKGSGNLPALNPRSAIGQRGDGSFLLLAIDGRGPSSFGALYEDVVDVFVQNDCVMAANLDGGNSTAMMYEGEYINNPVSMEGSRHLPTVFLVRGDN